MDGSNLHKIENGRYGLSRTYVRALARALMVPVEQLYAPIGAAIPFTSRPNATVEPRPYHPDHALPAIARRLHAVLTDLEVPPESMAQMIGATEEDMRDWLAARTRPPPLLMDRLANRAAITLAWLYFGDAADLLPGVAARLAKLLL
jgi:hypothetical protein